MGFWIFMFQTLFEVERDGVGPIINEFLRIVNRYTCVIIFVN